MPMLATEDLSKTFFNLHRPAGGHACRSSSLRYPYVQAGLEWCKDPCPAEAGGWRNCVERLSQDLLGQEHQRVHCVIPCCWCDLFMHSQVCEQCLDVLLSATQVLSRLHAMKPDRAPNPVTVGALRVDRIVTDTHQLAHVIQEIRRAVH